MINISQVRDMVGTARLDALDEMEEPKRVQLQW